MSVGSLLLGPGTYKIRWRAVNLAFGSDTNTEFFAMNNLTLFGRTDVSAPALLTISNVAPTTTLSGPSRAAEGQSKTYSFGVTDPGNDTFSAAAGFPDCGSGGSLVSGSLITNASGGSFDCSFPDGPASTNVSMRVADSDGSLSNVSSVTVTVNNVDPVLDPAPTSPVDLNTWTQAFPLPAGDWAVAGGGGSVFQSINGLVTVYYSDIPVLGQKLEGKIKVETTGDDDLVGFVLGFEPGDDTNPNADYLLVDWKQGTQSVNFGGASCTPGSTAPRGLAVSRVSGVPTEDEFWGHTNFNTPACSDLSSGLQQLQRGATRGSTGWGDNVEYTFEFDYSATNLIVKVNGTVELNINAPSGNPFPGGRLGFYNLSQRAVRYTSFDVTGIIGNEASPVTINRTFTDAGKPDTHSAIIDWGDTTSSPATVTSASGVGSLSATHTYADDGSYTIQITLDDDDTGQVIDTLSAAIANVDPTADSNGPYSGDEGSNINLSATGFDVAGVADPLTYAWDLDDDGSFETPGQNVAFSAADGPSTHTVKVQVSDGDGGTAVDSATITVNNVAPTATLTGPDSADEGQTQTYSFTVTDPGVDTFSVASGSPDCGTGGDLVAGSLTTDVSGGSFDCLFPDGPATPTVSIQVADSDNDPSVVSTVAVAVSNVAPTVVGFTGPVTADEGQTKTYSFTVTDPGVDTFSVASGSPDCGTGGDLVAGSLTTDASGGSFDCSFPDGPATPTVSIQVEDSDNDLSNTPTVDVTVANVAPTVDAGPATAENFSGQIHQINATFTDPGLSDTHSATIDWDDGTPQAVTVVQGSGSGSLSGSHQYLTTGYYDIVVTDNDGDPGTGEQVKTVIRLLVTIDIKPGGEPNSINLGNKGVIPVGVFSGTYFDVVFDATTIVGSSLVFEGTGIAHGDSHVEDLDGTSPLDSVSHYRTQETTLTESSVEGCLIGVTSGGIEFAGCDSVRIVPPDNSNAGGNDDPAPSSAGGNGKGGGKK
jgi:hypothetical protein